MSGFSLVNKLLIPLAKLEFIYNHLRESGRQGMEGIGLLFGKQHDVCFEVTNALIPGHKSYRTENGLLYIVEGQELHRMNVWAYQHKVTLIAQIHSHPTTAFHSETDDEYPIVTTLGGLSIVVPNFGSDPIDPQFWEVYRLSKENKWDHLSREEVLHLFEIV